MELRCRGLLFDLDGTLIDSLHAVDRAWSTWALRHRLDPADVLPLIHGRRSIESIRAILPEIDAEAEDLVLRQIESTDIHGVKALPGAPELLRSLPPDRWGVVTSGTSDVALARLGATGIPVPRACVFGEDVRYGKPHPEPYLRGASLLGLDPADLVAFEDTSAGLQSIVSAGIRAVAVSFPYDPVIYDYRHLSVRIDGDALMLSIQTG
ncbi:MAG TPA: HAD-IA family hydrolase [Fimbriimonadaceae bacterium]|nr:HAD-IA family hydrolase [Fimbriimonadaceae bacterium]